ncbi:hypothetical protein [Aureimonas sp. AU4]|uniref:DUF6894 family protein n=1 Tax=Aureimonas sp. AU4 TaxID=1638163 RepID=UPI0035B584F4
MRWAVLVGPHEAKARRLLNGQWYDRHRVQSRAQEISMGALGDAPCVHRRRCVRAPALVQLPCGDDWLRGSVLMQRTHQSDVQRITRDHHAVLLRYPNRRHRGRRLGGGELTSSEEAQHEAVLAAREMMAERLRRGQPLGGHCRFVIRDGRGSVISDLQFCDAIPIA